LYRWLPEKSLLCDVSEVAVGARRDVYEYRFIVTNRGIVSFVVPHRGVRARLDENEVDGFGTRVPQRVLNRSFQLKFRYARPRAFQRGVDSQ
jgi:hypothetical protein